MTFTRLLSRGSVCESALTHNQSVQPRVFVLVGHSIGESDSIAIQQSIELDKVELGRLIGGDGSHLVEHQAGLFVVSAGYRHIGAELGEADGNCELSALGSNCGGGGGYAPGSDSLRPACDEDILPSEVVLQVFCLQKTDGHGDLSSDTARAQDGWKSNGWPPNIFIYLFACCIGSMTTDIYRHDRRAINRAPPVPPSFQSTLLRLRPAFSPS